ncbi:MAG: 3-isopropylmalate dehydratase large subunit [bacterium]|nr:3-isopropylmalate dehydratase large subunit [bacterium]MCP4799435.1 3-isopropylmalate dehydratase large subunit [bacterium]
MGLTLIEKIISNHCDQVVKPGDTADMRIDIKAARDFGGANVVKNLKANGLNVADPETTVFTFDCNPGGSDQGYAANQQTCREYARETGVGLRDITDGIGTHIALEDGYIGPGMTFVSTDSHANIMGSIGAFGQGMGDQDIAYAWASGKVWFKVPKSAKVVLKGTPAADAQPKDLVLKCLQHFGAGGLLGFAAEFYGEAIDDMNLAGRITFSSMATEMGAIIALLTPSKSVMTEWETISGRKGEIVAADADAHYDMVVEVDVDGVGPMVARPGHPEDTIAISEVAGRKVDSIFIGSCTNGRIEDLRVATEILKDRKVAPGVVCKIVPSTRRMWQQALDEGLIDQLMKAGCLVGNPGCGGCAAGQIGQNGPGEVTVSTGNRNFAGKQGKGEVYLSSPATAAACAVTGVLCSASTMPAETANFDDRRKEAVASDEKEAVQTSEKPTVLKGRVWMVGEDNIDTDMIFHNRYLAITDPAEMGQYTFDNLEGWEDFATKAKPGDIVVTGSNFGCGSSRQQAVDCFATLGVVALVAQSYGSIYERNAINAGMPIVVSELVGSGLKSGSEISVNLETGLITWDGGELQGDPFSPVQMEIYQRGGLLAG